MTETPQTIRAFDWRGLTERIRAWQAVTFPGVTEEVGKWRTLNEIAEKNADFSKLLASWRRFRDDQNAWFRVAENTLDGYRYGVSAAR
jgi:TRAP-type mannitol/chloroaromatic compound transport system substrate-binding protein